MMVILALAPAIIALLLCSALPEKGHKSPHCSTAGRNVHASVLIARRRQNAARLGFFPPDNLRNMPLVVCPCTASRNGQPV